MEFIPLKQALNWHVCGFGDCIVDTDYKDGERHSFFVRDNEILYDSNTNRRLNKEPNKQAPSISMKYHCGDFKEIYPDA